MLSSSRRLATPQTLRICSRCLSTSTRVASRLQASRPTRNITPRLRPSPPVQRIFSTTPARQATASTAAEAMETIESLYENASEEFQIAAEETEANTVYASDDRAAAKAEVDKLAEFYTSVVEGNGYDVAVRDEVKRRAGTRVRELVNAMVALEERALEEH